tara:strand:+ start:565 stop:912 length:348 start_codon:yes stop_codon:yes gene_type:complete
MKIYHNPRCRKSREVLSILSDNNINYEIILYLTNPPNPEKLKSIIQMLNITPFELIRKEESIYKNNFKNKEFTDEEYIDLMCLYPVLIQRPIVIKDNNAVLGRPPINVLDLLNKK